MEHSVTDRQESTDRKIIEDIYQLKKISLGEGAAACEVCGAKLREGDVCVAFAFRPADQPAFEIGHVKCSECRHEPSEYFTLGVREIVLDGRIGTCSDQATQSSWPVLLAPRPRAVSPAAATTVYPLPGVAWFRRAIAQSDRYVAADCTPNRKPWQRAVVRADTTNECATDRSGKAGSDDTTGPHPLDGPGGAQ
ncbi:Uncharacterized protein AArcS_1594 [Natranaeroarchaeum sulfidigenes]|uniref:DUF8112 domain-containing protein n=1 Tax=Natranaeroarchaeum sulfidigenes TaxID=2784880 RepID=A0A897MWV9_9EURY|nr:Uncharacterized protein AArcS_1594 [Natranaeroarchaeum sulfidigenes]